MGQVLDGLAALESAHRDWSFDALRASVLAGEDGAWRRLIEKYSRFTYTVTLRLLDGAADREELAAQIYTRVFERLASHGYRLLRHFEGRCRFSTYLYRIIQSERKRALARCSAEPKRSDLTREIADPQTPSVPVLQPATLRGSVRQALATLSAEDRLLLVLRFRDGLKLRELAIAGGFKDLNAAAYALRRALARLSQLRDLRQSARLGETERASLEELLRRELLAREPVKRQAGAA